MMLLDDIYVMWIPILAVALMTALGVWRGVYREIPVAAAIALSALIVVQWAGQDRWARDLSTTFSGLGVGEWQFFLTLVLMGLIVAVVGYGLGGLFARRSLSSPSRVLGGILGLANGAALAGWVLRAAYEGLVNRQETSAVYQNPISLSLMVWAGWFPVALAVTGAVAALIFSLRGDRVASAPESTRAPATYPATGGSVPVYTRPVSSTLYPPIPVETGAYQAQPPDAQSTMYMPTRDAAANAPTAIYPMVPPPPPANLTPHQQGASGQYAPFPPAPDSATTLAPAQGPSARTEKGRDDIEATSNTHTSDAPHTPPFGYDLAAMWGNAQQGSASQYEATSRDAPPGQATQSTSPVETSVVEGNKSGDGEIRCRNCGNPLQASAVFCTECGTRV